MKTMKARLLVALNIAFLSAGLQGQAIVGAGSKPSTPIRTAPGQILTIYVQGLRGTQAFADRLPLPTTLAGVSVFLVQNGSQIPVPLFSIQPAFVDAVTN